MKKIIYTCLFILLSAIAIGQTYTYQFKIADSDNADVRKNAQLIFFNVFHMSASYDKITQTYTVKSDVSLTESEFTEKLSANGYTLTFFHVTEADGSVPVPESKD